MNSRERMLPSEGRAEEILSNSHDNGNGISKDTAKKDSQHNRDINSKEVFGNAF